MSVESYLKEERKRVYGFRVALSSETDRGCALFASSYIDKALSDLLYCALANTDKGLDKDLLKGTAPLSTFSARIKMAFYLGKISKVERKDLDLIRKIRNEFAHNADAIDFDFERINNQCRELSFSYHESDSSPRDHFVAACLGLLGNIFSETLRCEASEIKKNNAPSEDEKKSHREFIDKLIDK